MDRYELYTLADEDCTPTDVAMIELMMQVGRALEEEHGAIITHIGPEEIFNAFEHNPDGGGIMAMVVNDRH